MSLLCSSFQILLLFFIPFISKATELTFELPDSAKQCFHEIIKKNTSVTLEYQVVTGGQYDVDVTLEDPSQKIIYNQIRMQYDSYNFITNQTGVYVVCFSNEFSTFSHKIVYLDFQVGEEKSLPGLEEHDTVMTQMELTAQDIHKALNTILDYQTHHRLREAQGRKRAEELNERVMWWSFMESIAIVVISLVQVFVLKNFFAEKKPLNYK